MSILFLDCLSWYKLCLNLATDYERLWSKITVLVSIQYLCLQDDFLNCTIKSVSNSRSTRCIQDSGKYYINVK